MEMEATRLAHIPDDHPLINRLYPHQRRLTTPTSPPPLPVFDPQKKYKSDPRKRFSTCITRIVQHIIPGMERIRPLLESPWDASAHDITDRIQLFTPPDDPGNSFKQEWADDHMNFVAECEDDLSYPCIPDPDLTSGPPPSSLRSHNLPLPFRYSPSVLATHPSSYLSDPFSVRSDTHLGPNIAPLATLPTTPLPPHKTSTLPSSPYASPVRSDTHLRT
ncbi:uncharacterized protein EI90DRAFT_3116377 [Cantharellus anzutake]|uniref:uncharacterized protein n=1 Tax=Cantharellus anzutake TaxID=1750568 RepID=UPI001902F93C|nr:uncharacterized protein EI90DRAFT_3116377 [Cantharellus anzutake]KAF8341235.1 hypothetical protein EI90DRAFT_3116377 [Cantharellus anzutake]